MEFPLMVVTQLIMEYFLRQCSIILFMLTIRQSVVMEVLEIVLARVK